MTNPTNGVLGTQDVALWSIQDNDFAPTVQFSQANFSVNEGAGNGTLTLVRTGTLTTSSQVQVKITGGSATASADYTNTGFPLNVTFAANESIKTVLVPIINDTTIESTEFVLFELASVSNSTLGSQDFTTLRILDNDSSNLIVGGIGDNLLTGTRKKDRFVYETIQDGQDLITKFNVTKDVIDLSQIFNNGGYSSSTPFSDYVKLQTVGSNTAIQVAQSADVLSSSYQTLAVLENVLSNQLTSNNFLV